MNTYEIFYSIMGISFKLFFLLSEIRLKADSCVHQNTARCVLRHSKLISCPKTLALPGAENSLRSRKFLTLLMDD